MSIDNQYPEFRELSWLVAVRTTFFPLEHILERLKVESQKHSKKKSYDAARDLWKVKGIKGLFEGGVANFSRRITRDAYQWPLTILINRFWKAHFPERYNRDNLATNLLTGLTTATFVQAGIALPAERLFIEKAAKEGYAPFFKKLKHIGTLKAVATLYQGYQVTLIRHGLVWTPLFLSDSLCNRIIKIVDAGNAHPYLCTIGKTVVTSSAVVGIGCPFDFIRSRVLMKPELVSQGNIKAIKILYNQCGLKQFYSGASILWLHNCIKVFFLQTLFKYLNKS